jgi:hypothetical protein
MIQPEATNYLVEVGVPVLVAAISLFGVIWATSRGKKK